MPIYRYQDQNGFRCQVSGVSELTERAKISKPSNHPNKVGIAILTKLLGNCFVGQVKI
jgi:hypothetical protein